MTILSLETSRQAWQIWGKFKFFTKPSVGGTIKLPPITKDKSKMAFEFSETKIFNHWVLVEAGTQVIDNEGDRYVVVYAPDLPDDRQNVVLSLEDGKLFPTNLLNYPVVVVDRKDRLM